MTDSANPAPSAAQAAPERAVHIRNNANGAEYVVRTAEAAQRLYPEFEILHYEDGGAYPDPVETGPNLGSMKRAELEAHAESVGLPGPYGKEQYANVEALREAIEAHVRTPEAPVGDPIDVQVGGAPVTTSDGSTVTVTEDSDGGKDGPDA